MDIVDIADIMDVEHNAQSFPSAGGMKRGQSNDDEELVHHNKRARCFHGQVAPHLITAVHELDVSHLREAVWCTIEPFCHSGGGGYMVFHDGTVCREGAMLPNPSCLNGIGFEESMLVAQIPPEWIAAVYQHGVLYKAAMIGIDVHGTLHVISDHGHLLAEAPVVRCHEAPRVIELQMLGIHNLFAFSEQQLVDNVQWTLHHSKAW